jgi:hypothetical protein
VYDPKSSGNARDNLVRHIAKNLRSALKDFVGTIILALEVGDVVVTNSIVQFHADGAKDNYDPYQGVIGLDMLFYAEGALMLVLKLEGDKAYVMELEHGKTGWLIKEALTRYE